MQFLDAILSEVASTFAGAALLLQSRGMTSRVRLHKAGGITLSLLKQEDPQDLFHEAPQCYCFCPSCNTEATSKRSPHVRGELGGARKRLTGGK